MENKTYKIYYSWKMIMIALFCALMGFYGVIVANAEQWSSFTDLIMGVFGAILVLVGLLMFIYCINSRIRQIPALEICDDRVKMHVPLRNVYKDVMFEDVDVFQIRSMNSNKLIAIIYKPSGYRKIVNKSNVVKRLLIKFNLYKIGAVGSLNASNMTMKPKDICTLLNKQLKKHQELHNA
jgi:hypothetical protein